MPVSIATLPSGLRVVTDPMPHLETASLGVWVGAGSRDELPEEHGLSHMLEHMAFKGTRRRSALEIAGEIESAGGDMNAATGAENTAYYARVLAADAELAVDILADILTDSVFDPEELKREKNVVIQEIAAAEDAPDELVFELFTEAAFPGQPVGRPILGTPKTVSRFSPAAIRAYLARNYTAGNLVFSAAGGVDPERMVAAVDKAFAGLPRAATPTPEPARYTGGEARLKRRLEQAQIVVGFEGAGYRADNCYATRLFANAVGEGMASRLFQEVREKRGLAYEIYTFAWSYFDSGLTGFYAAADGADLAELMHVATDCLGAACDDLSEAELHRAKSQMKVSLLAALESSSARAEQIARQTLAFGHVLTREEAIGRIDALTLADVRAAGRKALARAPTVASIGPVGKALTPDQVAARLASLRPVA
jgi:predicted Zn-dependent peptidase